jgi:hypothetical protein
MSLLINKVKIMNKIIAKIAVASMVLSTLLGAASLQAATTPTNKDQCKKDGWKTFTTPVFKNQGDCVSFVEHLKHAPTPVNALKCFDGVSDATVYGGNCTISNGVATLNNSDSNVNGDYSGVYYETNTINGMLLSSATSLGYTYSGNIAPLPGDLSLNIHVDENGDGTTDAYAYVDAFYCPGTAGVVDVINDPVCGIWYKGMEYVNWSAFVSAFPTAKFATDGVEFIVAERIPTEPSAVWTVSNVNLGQ